MGALIRKFVNKIKEYINDLRIPFVHFNVDQCSDGVMGDLERARRDYQSEFGTPGSGDAANAGQPQPEPDKQEDSSYGSIQFPWGQQRGSKQRDRAGEKERLLKERLQGRGRGKQSSQPASTSTRVQVGDPDAKDADLRRLLGSDYVDRTRGTGTGAGNHGLFGAGGSDGAFGQASQPRTKRGKPAMSLDEIDNCRV